MTPVTLFAGRHVALFGLGGSGLVTARALHAGGARVTAWDDDAAACASARAAGIATADLRTLDWSDCAALVLAPGVPLTHPAPHWSAVLARQAGVEIIGDIELFFRLRAMIAPRAPCVAITGTNGKSTTTALTAHILAQAGRDVQMGGNIGTAILALEPPAPGRIHVIECSSFQIDLAPSLRASVGALLNVTPDHLDRHGTLDAYAAIKARLVAQAETAFVGIDDDLSRAICEGLPHATPVSVKRALSQGVSTDGTRIFIDGDVIADVSGARALRGAHNLQNAAFAVAISRTLGVSPAEIQAGIATFPGLAHRMEEVGRDGRILFINDSKATNADAAEKALLSFRDIFWIAGGIAKEGGIAPLRPFFARIAKAYLIGTAAETFATTLDGAVAHTRSGTLETAVAQATADARASDAPEPVVLLSPACASYDQFKNFGVRGDRFRDIVHATLAKRN